MIDPTPDLIRLAEAELVRAELKARRAGTRLSLIIAASFIAGLALIMLTASGYFALAGQFGSPLAALITAIVLALVALVVVLVASRKPGRAYELEMQLAEQEIERARLQARLNLLQVEKAFGDLEKQFSSISRGISGLLGGTPAGDGKEGIAGGSTLPLILLGLRALSAVSPALGRYIQPILRAIGG
ncbi:MAG: phage holin family protein [Parvibaculaceae bacterium]|nr:phage holin family protein [Parvibaculaceae bacterium]